MSAKGRASTSKACSFCNSAEDNELEYGKIHEYNGIVTHYYCLLLSSNMEQKGDDNEGILGFLTEDIQKELRRGKRLACSYCKKSGATLGCCNLRCKRIFHFPCGLKAGSLHQFFGEFRSYCITHRPKQKIDDQILNQIASVDNVICYICYDKVNVNDFVKTLWAPCCRKDAWFHRNCVQQLALSAGYFFKCPLCNNKKDFQKAMLECGIFVPSQDASWELVPNAFEELLYRHDQCDASKCLCPKGRKHTSNNAKWELALCRTCGSQGIHMACGQLKWANPVWECEECISILHNAKHNTHNTHARLGNSSALISSDQNKDSDSDSDSESESDSDSDTDISVGNDFPVSCSLPSLSPTSLQDSMMDVSLRPGPRSFKLQQQKIRLSKCSLDLQKTDEKNVTEASPKKINESTTKNNDEKKEPLTSKENISQQEVVKDEEKQEEKQFSKNDEKSQPIQEKEGIITIESDDDVEVNDVEFVTLTQNTNPRSVLTQQLTQSGSSNVSYVSTSKQITTSRSLLHTTKNSAVESMSPIIATMDLSVPISIIDHIDLSKPTTLKSEVSNKNGPTILDKVDLTTPQKSTLNLVVSDSNDLEETDAVDTNETSVMNIKITNVTSLPPEVFASVPDVICNDLLSHTNTAATSSLSANKTLQQLGPRITTPFRASKIHRAKEEEELGPLVSSMKRSIYEENYDVTDNCKKLKMNIVTSNTNSTIVNTNSTIVTSNTNSTIVNTNSTIVTSNTNSTIVNTNSTIVTSNTNSTQNDARNETNINNTNKQQGTSASKSNEIGKNDKNPLKCTSTSTNIFSSPLNINNISVYQNILPLPKANDVRHVSQTVSQLKGNDASVNVGQSNENLSAQMKTITKNDLAKNVYMQVGGYYISPGQFTINQNFGTINKANVYAIPSSSVNPHKSDTTVTVYSKLARIPRLNQPIITNATASILNGNQTVTVAANQQVASRRSLPASLPSVGNNFLNKSHCAGDAGTRSTDSTSQEKDHPPSSAPSCTNAANYVNQQFIPHQNLATPSVFPEVTNNHNTCHKPGLIPQYMDLHDLKFRVCPSNMVQMTLYDTFSVNITLAKPKKRKSRSVGVVAPQGPKESSTLASRDASCSSDYTNNNSTEGQHSDKFFRASLKNENCSVSDKSTCAKYVAHGQDDTKENLDPIRSRMLSNNDTPHSVSPTNNVDDAGTMSDRFCDENDSETRLVSSDTNLSVLNRTVCNANVDKVTDDVTLIPNNYNNCSQVNLESVQQHKQASVHSAIPLPGEERPGARLFFKETNTIVHNDIDLNVNMYKNIEKVSQDDITIPKSQYTDGDRIGNDHTNDSPTLQNGYKHLDSTNVMRSKVSNWNVARVSNIARFNEHSNLNKQVDACDSKKFTQCIGSHENTIRRNGETRTKSNDKFCLKVSVDLDRIQNLIDSKPELFENPKHDAHDQRHTSTSRLSGLGDCARQQVRYCENLDSIGNCSSKNRELQKSNYARNIEQMQRDIFLGANTFLQYQKSSEEVKYFNKDNLDR